MLFSFLYIFVGIHLAASSLRDEILKHDIPRLDEALQNIFRTSVVHDITILVKDLRNNDRSRCVIDTVTKTAIRSHPTSVYVVGNKLDATQMSRVLDTSRTLQIYIYAGKSMTKYDIYDHIRITVATTHRKDMPRMLIITVLDDPLKNAKELMQVIFDHRAINVAMLDIQFPERSVHVHVFNPFTNYYSNHVYSGETLDLFPDKLRDVSGYTMNVQSVNHEPYFTRRQVKNESELDGITGGVVYALRESMNFTLNLTSNRMNNLFNSKLLGLASNSIHQTFTTSVGRTGMCICMPQLVKKSNLSLWNIFATITIGSMIAAIFRLFYDALNIESELMKIFDIFKLILGISIESLPSTLSARIMFLCLVAATTRYAAMFQTELFNIAVINNERIKITSFDDLDKYELGLFTWNETYEYYIKGFNISPSLQKRMALLTPEDFVKLAVKPSAYDKTVSFMADETCHIFSLRMLGNDAKRVVLTSEFCPVTVELVYVLPEKSPYLERINEVLLRVREYGLAHMYELSTHVKNQVLLGGWSSKQIIEDTRSAEFRVLLILFGGYLLSILLFVAEKMLHRTRTRNQIIHYL